MLKEKILNTSLTDTQIGLFYVGQLGFIVKFRGKYLLIDGYLSDYVDKKCTSEVFPMVRNYPVPIAPTELDFLDYVFCTHDHADHADPYTLSGIAAVNGKARFFAPQGVAYKLKGYGVPEARICGVATDEAVALCEGIGFTAIPAAHEELHSDGMGGFLEVGYKFELGSTVLYHGGDCCPYDGLESRVKGSDIMIMPINGRDYYRRYEHNIIGNFTVRETVLLAKRAGAKLLIPAHFDLYPLNGEDPASFVAGIYKFANGQPFHIFMPGELYVYNG